MKNTFLAILVLASSTAFAQDAKLTLTSDVWPPFTNVEGEKAISFDIVREALNRMDIRSEFIVTEFDSVLAGIDNGTFNGSAALWKSKQREEELIFSNAYLQNQLILVGKKGSDPNVASLAELKGKRIGLVEGYAYDEAFQTDGSVEIVYGETDQENLERLLSGEIDFMMADNLLIQYSLKYETNDISSLLEFAKAPLINKPLYFALSKTTPDAGAIMERFNNEIKNMLADGSYNALLEMNWVRADVDGDGTLELIFTGTEAGVAPPTNVYSIIHNGNNESADEYYINGNLYANWDDVPQDIKVEEANPIIRPTVAPSNALIHF